MRHKYIEEAFPRYFIFGESKDSTTVDVSDGDGDIVQGISRQDAKRLIHDRDWIVDTLICVLGRLDEAVAYDLLCDLRLNRTREKLYELFPRALL